MAISLSSFASSFSALIISSSKYVSAVSLVTTRILSTVARIWFCRLWRYSRRCWLASSCFAWQFGNSSDNVVNVLRLYGNSPYKILERLVEFGLGYDPAIHSLKPFKGQRIVSDNVRHLLRGSSLVNTSGIQDIYSVRCVPQVHGGIREALEHASHIAKIELNSVTDNPVFIKNEETNLAEAMAGGNFHGESVGIAMDALAIAISELANISDRRIAALLDDRFNNGLCAP